MDLFAEIEAKMFEFSEEYAKLQDTVIEFSPEDEEGDL